MTTTPNDFDPGYDFEITRTKPRASCGGTWVSGRLSGYRFDALVFPEHAECPDWELGTSRISKLWLQRRADRETVFNWDRGADVAAANDEVQAVVDFLAEGLADLTYA
jgi:hypothetical protein